MEKIETVDMVALARTASEAEGKLGIRVEDMAAGVDTLVGLIERSGLSKEERLPGGPRRAAPPAAMSSTRIPSFPSASLAVRARATMSIVSIFSIFIASMVHRSCDRWTEQVTQSPTSGRCVWYRPAGPPPRRPGRAAPHRSCFQPPRRPSS